MPETKPFPALQTRNYQLRRIVATDMPAIFKGLSDPRVTEYYGISYDSLASSQEQMDWYEQVWLDGTGLWWGICSQSTPELLIGTCGLHEWEQEHHCAETGFWLFPDHWGRAVIPECMSAMITHCFQHQGLHRLQAMVEPENIASCRLIERLGFRLKECCGSVNSSMGAMLILNAIPCWTGSLVLSRIAADLQGRQARLCMGSTQLACRLQKAKGQNHVNRWCCFWV